ncbi:response regulator [Chloroflexota bacterium]
MNMIKVLVVDDHVLFRRGIVSVLADDENMEVVGEASDGLEAIEKAKETHPDIIVMDLNMPHFSGLDATQALQAEMPQVSILILTISDRQADLFSAMKFGARGYMLKETTPDELVHAISYIAQGGVLVSPLMATKLLNEFRSTGMGAKIETSEEGPSKLSLREVEALKLVAQGLTNKQIAESLYISENTVKTHLRNIMEKLHLTNRSQAVAYAFKKGLTKSDNG